MPLLKNWGVAGLVDLRLGVYSPPELIELALCGEVHNHPRFDDGKFVITSAIKGIEGDKIRTRSGSLYELGEPDESYEKKFPNAKERLLTSLKKGLM